MIKEIILIILPLFVVACSAPKYKIVDSQTQQVQLPPPKQQASSKQVHAVGQQLELAYANIPGAMVITLVNQVKVSVPSDPMFKVASAELVDGDQPELQPFIDVLSGYPQANVLVEGMTDSSGSAQLNLKLSKERAQKVADYLQDHGLSEDKFMVNGYGDKFPVASNATKDGKAENRRIVLTVLP